jgi:hypothetical protein
MCTDSAGSKWYHLDVMATLAAHGSIQAAKENSPLAAMCGSGDGKQYFISLPIAGDITLNAARTGSYDAKTIAAITGSPLAVMPWGVGASGVPHVYYLAVDGNLRELIWDDVNQLWRCNNVAVLRL